MRRWGRGVALAGALLVTAGACGGDDSEDLASGDKAPTTTSAAFEQGEAALTIISPDDGAKVKGNVVTLDLDVEGIRIVKADGDTSGRTGHYHVFIDKAAAAQGTVIPREAGVVHTTDDPVKITGLTKGTHRITAVLGDGAHTRLGDTEASISVTVEGPSLDASAPATAPAGTPVKVTTEVEDLQIVKGGQHLHLFVDKDPTSPGTPIPQGDPAIIHTADLATEVANLAPGEHVIWVVAGDAGHVPLDPPVLDKVTVTVQ
ncbi:MAG: DUF4399 domain-containing protein [Actinomycetota bacterium]|nr:DUF4399 domain-containing protein [Actinomycetota bacterium]